MIVARTAETTVPCRDYRPLPPTRRSVLAIVIAALSGGGLSSASSMARSRIALPETGRVPHYAGVNLAGAEFGKVPGLHGREYLYPASANIDYFAQLGFNLFRIPFRWERLQPELRGPFAPQEQALLTRVVREATRRGLTIVIDPHNYAKRRLASDGWSVSHAIGSDAVPASAFADFWARLAALFKDNDRVFFGLMNEPADIAAADWLGAANLAIAAIRSTGAGNLVLVPGVAYTGAHSWHASGNTILADIVDPAGNFAIEVHQYFDADSSGTHPESVSGTIGSERIKDFQDWARARGFKAFLGEFGCGSDPVSLGALADICREMRENADVWLGWAAWAGGPRWPETVFTNLEQRSDGREREQITVLKAYAQPRNAIDGR